MNRLKLIKRSMYNRAKFDLLRLRVLHRTADRRQGKSSTAPALQTPKPTTFQVA